jgi:hypothetical protein
MRPQDAVWSTLRKMESGRIKAQADKMFREAEKYITDLEARSIRLGLGALEDPSLTPSEQIAKALEIVDWHVAEILRARDRTNELVEQLRIKNDRIDF